MNAGHGDGPAPHRALVVATLAKSLVLQAPQMWTVLHRRGYALHLAAKNDEWTDDARRVAQGAGFTQLPSERRPSPRSVVRTLGALRALARSEWDLVQVQSPIVSALWRVVAPRKLRQRTIYVSHGFHFQPGERSLTSLAFRVIETLLAHRTRALATVNHADTDFLHSLPRMLQPELIWHLPGAGIDTVTLKRDSDAAFPPPPRPPRALFVGDLNHNKDPLLVIDVVERVRQHGRDLQLTIIGDGVLASTVRARELDSPWLTWIDRTDKVADHMLTADVLLAPSRREGLGRAVIEALACGIPVVARSNRGSREVLRDGIGRLHEGTDVDAWAGSVAACLDEPGNRRARQDRAAEYRLELFTESYEELIREVETMTGLGSPAPAT